MRPPPQPHTRRYDNLMVILHWVIAVGIVALAGIELMRHEFPKGSLMREGLKPIHQPLGTLLFALILVRVSWRVTFARLPDVHSGRVWSIIAAGLVHLALYGAMLALPLLGLIYVFGSGKSVDFGLFTLALPLKEVFGSYAKSARSLHETLGVGILLLSFLHAAAALFHHYVLKDGLLDRMRLARRAPAGDTTGDMVDTTEGRHLTPAKA